MLSRRPSELTVRGDPGGPWRTADMSRWPHDRVGTVWGPGKESGSPEHSPLPHPEVPEMCWGPRDSDRGCVEAAE